MNQTYTRQIKRHSFFRNIDLINIKNNNIRNNYSLLNNSNHDVSMQPKLICFAGNPNVGKSSWINLLSDATFTIGNYPGVTVEKKEATVTWDNKEYHLVDLPGLYSLYHSSNEETIARDVLLSNEVDVIVNVIDTTNFTRNCELMLQLRELQIPMLILLNYKDEALDQNIQVKLDELQNLLGVKVILCSARKPVNQVDIEDIKQSIISLSEQSKQAYRYPYQITNKDQRIFDDVVSFITSLQTSYKPWSLAQCILYAIKWCEQEQYFVDQLKQLNLSLHQGYELLEEVNETEILDHREHLKQQCILCIHTRNDERLRVTKIIDQILLHRYAAMPLFLIGMLLMFYLVFVLSQPLTSWLDQFINQFAVHYIGKLVSFLPINVKLLIQKGFVQGVGGVFVFLPMLACLFFLLSFLEECGYFARIAFLFDRIMRPFGMSGRSFVSMMLGLGCNVPAILSTRTLHNEKAKWITALIIPFMSCTARLPIYLMFSYAFFPKALPFVVMILYGMGCYVALVLAYVYHRLLPSSQVSLFTIELPPYRLPSLSFLLHKVKIEVTAFMHKSFTIITTSMMILFICSYYPNGQLKDSYLMQIANAVSPIFEPLGFGDRVELIAALPGAIISKENVVGFLGQTLVNQSEERPLIRTFSYDLRKQISSLGQAVMQTFSPRIDQDEINTPLIQAIGQLWADEKKGLRAMSYLIYILLSIPCVMTLNTLYKEYGWKMVILSVMSMMVLPYMISFLIFQGFSLFY